MAAKKKKKKCSRRQTKGQFCGNAATGGCKCPSYEKKDYREICKPSWKNYEFLSPGQKGKPKVKKGYEAHHLLCVATVGKVLIGGKNIGGVIEQTKWCVNGKNNMLAMPLWGHTIMYYVNVLTGDYIGRRKAPSYKNLPQHDWDHNSTGGYRSEVQDELVSVADNIRLSKEEHDVEAANLVETLKELSREFRRRLRKRGRRKGGTHACWGKGKKDPKSRWFEPFSMGDDDHITEKGYPVIDFNKETADKIAWMKKQLKGN